jgi:hypothetical protein
MVFRFKKLRYRYFGEMHNLVQQIEEAVEAQNQSFMDQYDGLLSFDRKIEIDWDKLADNSYSMINDRSHMDMKILNHLS